MAASDRLGFVLGLEGIGAVGWMRLRCLGSGVKSRILGSFGSGYGKASGLEPISYGMGLFHDFPKHVKIFLYLADSVKFKKKKHFFRRTFQCLLEKTTPSVRLFGFTFTCSRNITYGFQNYGKFMDSLTMGLYHLIDDL